MLSIGCATNIPMSSITEIPQTNKIIPKSMEKEARIALSHYPELKDIEIEFKFKDHIKQSFMQAQPQLKNLFKGKEDRGYYIFISKKFKLEGQELSVDDLPPDVLIGWIGHELGHIMDYSDKSAFGLIIFGFKYLTSKNYIKEAERVADTYAVNHGMAEYILKTKDFILNHSQLSEAYKNRIRRLYLSPEEIAVLVNKMEEDLEEVEKDNS